MFLSGVPRFRTRQGRPAGWGGGRVRFGGQTTSTVDGVALALSAYVLDVSAADVLTATTTATRDGVGVSGRSVTLALSACTPSASASVVSVFPDEIANDGADTATLSVYVYDSQTGAVIPDIATARFSFSGTTNLTLTPVDSSTGSDGRHRWTVVSSTSSSYTIGVTVDGVSITDTAALTVSGAPAPASWPNEPAGFTAVAEWNDDTTLSAGGFTSDGTPFRSLTASSGSLGAITTTTTAIVAAAGSWVTAGLLDPATDPDNTPQYITLANQDAGNNGRPSLITSISGTTLNVTPIDGSALVANSTPDSDWTATAGWGEYSVVTSGYTGSPSIGGTHAMQRFYPAGADGGHDAGRIGCTLDSSKSEVFVGAEVQYANDSTTSTSLGGNKQLFIQTNGGSERIFSNFSATEAWNVYIGSTALTPTYTASAAVTYGSWMTQEFYCAKPSGADNDGVIQLFIDGTLAWEKDNCSVGGGTFPSGNFFSAYLDMSNNGNRYPTGADPRRIGVSSGSAASSTAWCAALYVSQPT